MKLTSERRYLASDDTDTHSSGPWWPAPSGPNSTAGMPAAMNATASDAPSRPTLITSLSGMARATASRRARTYGLARGTLTGGKMNDLMI